MEWAVYLLKSLFVLLGIITIVIGKYLSIKILMPMKIRHKVIDEEKYVKACRRIFHRLGFCYILAGIMLMIINGWPFVATFFISIIPALIVVVSSAEVRKHTCNREG